MSASLPIRSAEPLVLRELARWPARQILQRFTSPVLLLPRDLGEKALDETNADVEPAYEDKTPFQTLRSATSPLLRLAALCDTVAVPLEKSDRNVFAGMVTVGRATNNDVVIAASSVSKFHGYFTSSGGQWRYHDGGATNGSKVQGKPVARRGAIAVDDGFEIAFGPCVHALFKTPDGLVSAVRFLAEGPLAR